MHILSFNLKKKGYHGKCYNIDNAYRYFDKLNKDTFYRWIGRINIVKTTMLPKAIYRFNAIHRFSAIPNEISMAFFQRTRIKNFKTCMETQKTLNSHKEFEKEKH